MAMRGLRNMDEGTERIDDAAVRVALRSRAQKMIVIGGLIGAALTAAAIFV